MESQQAVIIYHREAIKAGGDMPEEVRFDHCNWIWRDNEGQDTLLIRGTGREGRPEGQCHKGKGNAFWYQRW